MGRLLFSCIFRQYWPFRPTPTAYRKFQERVANTIVIDIEQQERAEHVRRRRGGCRVRPHVIVTVRALVSMRFFRIFRHKAGVPFPMEMP
jgi:hypothetical protein